MRTLVLSLTLCLSAACADDVSHPTDTTVTDATTATTADTSPDIVPDTVSDSSVAPDTIGTVEETSATIEDTTSPTDVVDEEAPTPIDPPVVAITSHVDGQRVIGSRDVVVVGTLADTHHIDDLVITVDGELVASAYTQTDFSFHYTLADQHNRVRVVATNDAGLATTVELDLIYPYARLTTFEPAVMVLGQRDYTTVGAYGPTPSGLSNAFGHVAWGNGRLYLADIDNNRVLAFVGFPTNDDQSASFALGQPTTFTSLQGISRERVTRPAGVSIDGGRMLLNDRDSSRILLWDSVPSDGTTPPDHVIGQADFDHATGGCTRTNLKSPDDALLVDGHIIVGDTANHRVMIWNTWPTSDGQPADVVLGQQDFTHCAINDGDADGVTDATPSATTLYSPAGVLFDGARLVVADLRNDRVLFWNSLPTSNAQPADGVLGQPDFTSVGEALGAGRMAKPRFLASNGNQFAVSEENNNRVLIWDGFPETGGAPAVVIGQSDFDHGKQNDDDQDGTADAKPGQRTFFRPRSLAFVDGALVVGDSGNNRWLVFGEPTCTPNAGLVEEPPGSGLCIADPCATLTCDGERQCVRDGASATCECPLGLSGDCDTCVLRVGSAASGSDGPSWTDPIASPVLASELASGLSGAFGVSCQLWFHDGTHHVDETSVTDSVKLRGDIAIYGGFAGDETTIAARHGGATILEGGNRARHVVSVLAGTGIIDRLTLQGGNAAGSGSDGYGGGILVNAPATIRDCVVRSNVANDRGGGIYVNGTRVTVERTTIVGNRGVNGGGLRIQGDAPLDVHDVVAAYNISSASGGGIDIQNGTGTIVNALVYGNSGVTGGGIRVHSVAVSVSGATVVGNLATTSGGGIATIGAVSDVIVWDNFAPIEPDLDSTQAGSICSEAPTFLHAPRSWDAVAATSTVNTLMLTRTLVQVGDVIGIGGYDVPRTVTAVDTSVHFTPALPAAPAVGTSVTIWPAGETDVLGDLHLDAASACGDFGFEDY